MRSRSLRGDAESFYRAVRELLALTAARDKDVQCAWGISISECHAIEHLASSAPSSLKDLAAALKLDKSTTSRLVTGLERKRLVTRRADANDRRVSHIELTAKGRRVADETAEANQASYERALELVSVGERTSLIEAAQRLATVLGRVKPR